MMKGIVVFKRLLASGDQYGRHQTAIYSNGGNCWNILGFNFNKRDGLSSVYKISMVYTCKPHINHKYSLVIITPRVFSSTMLYFG